MYRAELCLRSLSDFAMMGAEGRTRQLIILRAFLEALAVSNWQYIEAHGGNIPPLYERKPAYRIKARAGEVDAWDDLPATYARGEGDCKSLACIRVAELRAQGIANAVPFIRVAEYKDPSGLRPPLTVFHVQVSARGKLEDPSAILGMPKTMSFRDLVMQPNAAGIDGARWGAYEWAG